MATQEQRALATAPLTCTIALAAGATNSIDITITVVDGQGYTKAGVYPIELYMSGAAAGTAITAQAYSGALTASTGAIITALTAKKHVKAVTAATGILVINIVDSAKPATEYACVVLPNNQPVKVSAASGTSWGA